MYYYLYYNNVAIDRQKQIVQPYRTQLGRIIPVHTFEPTGWSCRKTKNCHTHAHAHININPVVYRVIVENIILKAPSSRCSECGGDSPTGADGERARPNAPRADATARRPRPTLDHSASGCAVVPSFAWRNRPCRRFRSSLSFVRIARVSVCEFSAYFCVRPAVDFTEPFHSFVVGVKTSKK